MLNTLRSRQDGRDWAEEILRCIFFDEYCCILIEILWKYVQKRPNQALVQIMARRRAII